jgi:GNAT superfamily N-acetyltransferase
MQVRPANIEDAEEACRVIRRSITELCYADHQDDDSTLALWLANKTAENMNRWIAQHHVFVAAEGDVILGVGAIRSSGEIILNYVAPDARFRGISKAILAQLEARASDLAVEIVTLESSATARKFYLAAGYRENGPTVEGFGKTLGYPMAKHLHERHG